MWEDTIPPMEGPDGTKRWQRVKFTLSWCCSIHILLPLDFTSECLAWKLCTWHQQVLFLPLSLPLALDGITPAGPLVCRPSHLDWIIPLGL
jgi:hypothetical protein